MKPNPTRKAPALPKARVMLLNRVMGHASLSCAPWQKKFCRPGAFIPCRTKAQARELIRIASFFAMGEEEQRKTVAKIMSPDLSRVQVWSDKACDWSHQYTFDLAAAVLAAIKKGGRK